MAAINYVLTDEDFDGIIPRDFEKDQISLILLVQPEGLTPEEFTQKYRRVFGHLNRYAKFSAIALAVEIKYLRCALA